ncbi:MAG: tetratricopeptide repeat protein, partial [Candidatus Nitrosopolaris sp.]
KFRLYAVNFPAHFLVKHILGENSEIIIDPFNGGRIMDDYTLQELLDPSKNILLTRAYVEKATSAQVIIRMLKNLKVSYYESQNIDKAEIANEMIISIEPHNLDAVRDKGMILLKRKQSLEALEMLNMYLELDPEVEDADTVLAIIRQVRTELNKS